MTERRRLLTFMLCLSATAVVLASAAPAIAAPPGNDNFASATVLPTATSATFGGTNVDAGTEAGEDTCCFTNSTVWYRWTAPKTGTYRVELCSSSFNTFLKVFTGTALNALDEVGRSDDDPGCGGDGTRSGLTFIANEGQRYELQVGGAGMPPPPVTGTIAGSIALISPPNDSFADAIDLSGSTPAITGTNVDATTEPGEPTSSTTATVWYRWTAPTTEDYLVELCGSAFNTQLRILTGSFVGALVQVAENNDATGCGALGDRSAVTFSAGIGTTYYIQVGSGGVPQGAIAGSISPADADEDGIPDSADQCSTLPGPGPSGCPVVKRKLSFRYSQKKEKVTGRLVAADAPGCASGQKVRVFRKKKGPDKKIVSAKTKRSGKYSKAKKLEPGTYYSKVKRILITDVGNCAAKKSKSRVIG